MKRSPEWTEMSTRLIVVILNPGVKEVKRIVVENLPQQENPRKFSPGYLSIDWKIGKLLIGVAIRVVRFGTRP